MTPETSLLENPVSSRLLVASYLALSLTFFAPALLPSVMLFGTDHLGSSLFFEEFATESLRAGELPAWLPSVYGGLPFFANAMDTYYPLTFIFRLVGIATFRIPLMIFVSQLFLAGAGMMLLVRELGGRQIAAYTAGIGYMFTGFIVSNTYTGHDGRTIVATLAPLLFFSLSRAVGTGRPIWFLASGVALGCAALSNQIQSTYYLLIASGIWFVFLLFDRKAFQSINQLSRLLAGAIGAGLLSFSVAAINYVPFIQYISFSPRAGPDGRGFEYSTSWAMPPVEFLGVVVPERIGILQAYWGLNPMKLHTEYVGALVALLCVLGIFLLRRHKYAFPLLVISLFSLSISFGAHTPIYRLYYNWLPGTEKFRAPSIAFFLFVMCACIVAGLTLERLAQLRDSCGQQPRSRNKTRRPKRVDCDQNELTVAWRLTIVMVLAVAIWAVLAESTGQPSIVPEPADWTRAQAFLSNYPQYVQGVWRFLIFLVLVAALLWTWIRHRMSTLVALVALSAVSVADLWLIDKQFFFVVPNPSVSLAPDEIAGFLTSQEEQFRVLDLSRPQDNYLLQFGIELAVGEHGNQLQTYNEFLGAEANTYTDLSNLSDPRFLALANVKYVVSDQQVSASFLKPVFEGSRRDGRRTTVYENTAVLPRAFVVPRALRSGESSGALDLMKEARFDPRREVLLYQEPPISNEPRAQGATSVRTVSWASAKIILDVTSADSAYLVLTDNYYPGWIAEVNGSAVEIMRANHTFRAIPIGPGIHRVVFRFRSNGLRLGAFWTASTWVILALWLVGLSLRRGFKAGTA